MLSAYQFEVLSHCAETKHSTQRKIAEDAGISLGSVNQALKDLREMGFIDSKGDITGQGFSVLTPYRAKNAIILAAGMATRFAPLSFERPKAMFEVRGEILIERLIRQLKETGIEDITIVVGYMKESFFYLEEAFDVNIVVNPEYSKRNNHSSIWAVREKLGNTYIVSSDQYYSKNIFKRYVYESYFSAVFSEGETNEQTIATDRKNHITSVQFGGRNVYCLQGPAYFDDTFSEKFIEILKHEYDWPATSEKLWDTIVAEHLDELTMAVKQYEPGIIHEFDYINDLCAFDSDFFVNVNSKILDNICKTLQCNRETIEGIEPVKAGLTNLSVLFSANGEKYIYRHPGTGTEKIINREAEAYALSAANRLNFDKTFIYEDPKEGWKISRYIPNCIPFDYHNKVHVAKALHMLHELHQSGETSPWSFDFHDEAVKISELLGAENYPMPSDFESLSTTINRLAEYVQAESEEPVLCHNDFYGPNFLISDDAFYIIDWEYSAMGDYGCDIGNFIAQGSGYSLDEAMHVLSLYFGRAPKNSEIRHCLACTAIVGYYWYVWAIYKESQGNPVGEWLYTWYKAANLFGNHALSLYQ